MSCLYRRVSDLDAKAFEQLEGLPIYGLHTSRLAWVGRTLSGIFPPRLEADKSHHTAFRLF